MVIRAAADGLVPVKEHSPKYLFPSMIAKLMRNPNDQEALSYVASGMRFRGTDDVFSKSSLARLLCQFQPLLGTNLIGQIRDEVTAYPGFMGGGTENQVAMRRTSGYLFAERFPDANFHYGLSGKSLARECQEFMRRYGRTIYATSMWEYVSPIYHAVNTSPWLNVAEFAQDDTARLVAMAILDWMLTDYAINYHQGILLAPLQREKGLITGDYQLSYARSLSQWTGWLYWGGGNTPQDGDSFPDPKYTFHQPLGAVLHAASPWNPNPVIRNLGVKQLPGPYMLLQARGNWSNIEQTQIEPYRKIKMSQKDRPDSRYNLRSVYVNRDYAIGGSYRRENILDPYLPSAVASTVVWRSSDDCNWLLPVHPFWFTHRTREGSNEVLGDEDWSGVSPFLQMVHWENAAIMVWDIPRYDPYKGKFGKGSPKFPSERGPELVQCAFAYVPSSIDEKRESAAGFFLREGGVYIALRPLRNGAHWQSSRHRGFFRLAMPGSLVGFAIEVGDEKEFGSFNAFQERISANKLDLSEFETDKRAAYQSSRGHRLMLRHRSPGWLPDASINGIPLDFSRWPTCESPYVTCRNRVLDVNDGRQGFTINWQGDLPIYTCYDLRGGRRVTTSHRLIRTGKLIDDAH